MNLCIPWLIPLGAVIALLILVLRPIPWPWFYVNVTVLHQWRGKYGDNFITKSPIHTYGHAKGACSELYFLGTYVIDIAR
jgi:hypothetical protein